YRDQSTPVTSQSITVYIGGGNRCVTNIAPNGSYSVTAYLNGRLLSSTAKDSGGAQIGKLTYGYDIYGRQNSVTDARNGTTTTTFNDADLVIAVATPAPGTGQPAQTMTTDYDTTLRTWRTTLPDGASVTNEFYPTGELYKNYGARVYP